MIKPLTMSALLLAALYSAPGHASGVFPGTMCQPLENSAGLSYDGQGRAANSGAGTLRVVCPIPRENFNEGWKTLRVVVADRHQTQNISCEAWSSQGDGAGYQVTKSSTQYSPEWYQSETITFDPPSFVRWAGTFFLVCSLPPAQSGKRSTIASYNVEEKCVPGVGVTEYAGFPGRDDWHRHAVQTLDCH